MFIPVAQFCYQSRPVVDYSWSHWVTVRDVSASPEDNQYLRAIQSELGLWPYARGIIVLEQDVAVDPRHIEEITVAAKADPQRVIAVPYLVWPISTRRNVAIWAHSLNNDQGQRVILTSDQEPGHAASYFGLGCTYLPRRLVEMAPDTVQDWDYPHLDQRFSELTQRLGIGCTVTKTPAVHMHW